MCLQTASAFATQTTTKGKRLECLLILTAMKYLKNREGNLYILRGYSFRDRRKSRKVSMYIFSNLFYKNVRKLPYLVLSS